MAEVWIWHSPTRTLTVHVLSGGHYRVAASSALLPEMDLEELARFVRPGESQTDLILAFRAALRG